MLASEGLVVESLLNRVSQLRSGQVTLATDFEGFQTTFFALLAASRCCADESENANKSTGSGVD